MSLSYLHSCQESAVSHACMAAFIDIAERGYHRNNQDIVVNDSTEAIFSNLKLR